MLQRIYLALILLSLIAAIALLSDRVQLEKSAPYVQFVVDYNEIASYAERWNDPLGEQWIREKILAEGVDSLAVHEATLKELQQLQLIQLYPTSWLQLQLEEQQVLPENSTLLLFPPELLEEERDYYTRMVLEQYGAWTSYWEWQGQQGLLIQLPIEQVEGEKIGFALSLISELQQEGFQIIARVDSNKRWRERQLQEYLELLQQLQVSTLLFEEGEVFSYLTEEELRLAGQLLKEYGFTVGTIEFHEQNGLKKLIKTGQLDMVRLFSLSAEQLKKEEISRLQSMLSLAIKERNIRLLYFHLPLNDPYELEKQMEAFTTLMRGMKQEIGDSHLSLGEAIPFQAEQITWFSENRWLAELGILLGILAFLSFFAARFHMVLFYFPLPIGVLLYLLSIWIGIGAEYKLLISLSVAIVAPVFALSLLQQQLQKRAILGESLKHISLGREMAKAVILFAGATMISLYASLMFAALLGEIAYIQYIEQFRGVKLLLLGPYLLYFLFLLMLGWKKERDSWWKLIHSLLQKPILVVHLVIGLVIMSSIAYYLSRSGNAGVVLPLEHELRHWLQSIFGVRPRTKEIFLGHPILFIAIFIGLRSCRLSQDKIGQLEHTQLEGKHVKSNKDERYQREPVPKFSISLHFLFLVGLLGQISIISTFTHLHTPLLISIQRTLVGWIGGVLIGMVLLLLLWMLQRKMKSRCTNEVTR